MRSALKQTQKMRGIAGRKVIDVGGGGGGGVIKHVLERVRRF